MRVFGYKEVTRRCLEALELKGGDGGAYKLIGDIRVRSGGASGAWLLKMGQ
ncbi:hypothetical protein Tco_0552427, partial [Tanacetum coccineum]